MKIKNSFFLSVVVLIALVLFYLGLNTGSYDLDHKTILNALFHYQADNSFHYILLHLRMPRLFLAFLVGAGLSVSGYLMQSMVNNPLADPYMLGTASGASLGASLVYLIIPFFAVSMAIPAIAAFIGAMTITLLAVFIANEKGHIVPSKLLLAGVGLSSLSVAIISFMIFFSNDESRLKTILFWSMGSFEGAKWSYIPWLSVVILAGVLFYSLLHKDLNLLLLGESRSYNLGLNVRRVRWIILIGSTLMTGFCVAVSGPIGFVGLMVPHFIRGLFGVSAKTNVLFIAMTGGTFLLACDIFSRLIYPPTGMPIGIITSFMGIPFFVYLLSRNSFRFN